ncbi:MAG: T9SS type A sorting domain-containing protein [Bacteroidota bacterium]
MKKKITLFMLAVIPTILSAQPTITNAENFSIGTVLTFQQCNSTGVSPGNSGASQTWNFSTLTSLSTTSVETMVTPASTTHGNLFPTSNLVEKYSDGTFVYVHATADSSYLVGYVDTVNNYIIHYPNSLLFALRPITYSNLTTDAFSDIFSSSSYNFNGQGTSTINADGYGTLILPNGTYSNVLRLKITQNQTDTVLPSHTLSNSNTISYVWFDGIHTSALLKIDSTHTGTYTSKSVEYLLNETIGIEELTKNNDFNLYPNPSSGQFTILLPSDNAIISVSDLLGQQILKTQTAEKTLNLELDNNGIYFVQVTTKQGTTTRKLIVNR